MLKLAKLNPDKFILTLYVIAYPKLEAKIAFFAAQGLFYIFQLSPEGSILSLATRSSPLILSHVRKSLKLRDKTTAPTNRPMNPIEINPPIEPKKITSMGTGAPRPRRIGFKKLSDNMTNISQTANNPAVKVLAL